MRYAPAMQNAMFAFSDAMERPEEFQFAGYSPERLSARMDYNPVDTE